MKSSSGSSDGSLSLLSTYYVPGIVLSVLYVSSHLILQNPPSLVSSRELEQWLRGQALRQGSQP